MKSKLFTPAVSDHGDCFVNPPVNPRTNWGVADTQGGGALYPLKLDGSGSPKTDRNPASGPVTTSCVPEYDPSY